MIGHNCKFILYRFWLEIQNPPWKIDIVFVRCIEVVDLIHILCLKEQIQKSKHCIKILCGLGMCIYAYVCTNVYNLIWEIHQNGITVNPNGYSFLLLHKFLYQMKSYMPLCFLWNSFIKFESIITNLYKTSNQRT